MHLIAHSWICICQTIRQKERTGSRICVRTLLPPVGDKGRADTSCNTHAKQISRVTGFAGLYPVLRDQEQAKRDAFQLAWALGWPWASPRQATVAVIILEIVAQVTCDILYIKYIFT